MRVTIRDIINLPQFKCLKLVTAKNVGMDNTVIGCGILDYEFEESVKSRYQHTNFYPGLIVITSLLYAKDNEYLLMDAIKNLVAKKCSALVIKNIYQLEISNSVIKFANNNNFPIFILKDQDILFEHFIVNIHKIVEANSSIFNYSKKIEKMMNSDIDNKSITNILEEFNPLLESDFISIYFRFKKLPLETELFNIISRINEKIILTDSDSLFYYKKGFVLIHSTSLFRSLNIDEITERYKEAFEELSKIFYISISDAYHDLSFFNKAVNESFYTSVLCDDDNLYLKYQDIGTFKLIIPCKNCFEFNKYSQEYLDKIIQYDLEYNTEILNTTINYILSDGKIDICATKMKVHINTIRYRLNHLNELLNMNILEKDDYEKISFAIKIHYFQNKISEFEDKYNVKLTNHCYQK